MTADDRTKDPAWVKTEPLPNPVAGDGHAGGPAASADGSGGFDASGLPKKIAEVKRSAEVESILEALSYSRPHVRVDRSETNSDMAASHHVGPRAVPAAVPTSTLEPPLVLSQSLVEAIRSPVTPSTPPARPVIAKPPRVDHGATVLVARKKERRLLLALGPCAVLTVLVVWWSQPDPAPTTVRASAPMAVPAPMPSLSATAESPRVSAASVATAPIVTVSPSSLPVVAPPAAAPTPPPRDPAVAVAPSQRPVRAPVTRSAPKASAAPSAPPRDTSSLRTDFEIQN